MGLVPGLWPRWWAISALDEGKERKQVKQMKRVPCSFWATKSAGCSRFMWRSWNLESAKVMRQWVHCRAPRWPEGWGVVRRASSRLADLSCPSIVLTMYQALGNLNTIQVNCDAASGCRRGTVLKR